jgi:mitochondrial fission protein ELM1
MTVADQKSSQAVTLAKQVLQDKYGVQKVNISKMQGVPEMITIKQLSELVEDLIEDSMYYSLAGLLISHGHFFVCVLHF